MRRVSFLIDLAGESRSDRARVRLLVRRLLAHLSRQRPSPPRWSFRFYDSGLSPHAFDARLQARADAAARRAEADAGALARVRSWVDNAVRETAGVGSKRATGSEPNRAKASVPTRREFHACAPDAVAAFVDHFDETVALYHHREGDAFSEGGGDPDDRDEHERADPPGDAVDEASWFTTLARQMAATIHDAADLAGAVGGAGGADEHPDGHSLVLVIAKTPQGGAPPIAPGHPPDLPSRDPARRVRARTIPIPSARSEASRWRSVRKPRARIFSPSAIHRSILRGENSSNSSVGSTGASSPRARWRTPSRARSLRARR